MLRVCGVEVVRVSILANGKITELRIATPRGFL